MEKWFHNLGASIFSANCTKNSNVRDSRFNEVFSTIFFHNGKASFTCSLYNPDASRQIKYNAYRFFRSRHHGVRQKSRRPEDVSLEKILRPSRAESAALFAKIRKRRSPPYSGTAERSSARPVAATTFPTSCESPKQDGPSGTKIPFHLPSGDSYGRYRPSKFHRALKTALV